MTNHVPVPAPVPLSRIEMGSLPWDIVATKNLKAPADGELHADLVGFPPKR